MMLVLIFPPRIFKVADELENLGIAFNIALVPFFNEKEDLTSFPDFVKKIKSYKGLRSGITWTLS